MMKEKQERKYLTTFSGEAITMDKYRELLKDIATLIADAQRENFLLSSELEYTKELLTRAEKKINDAEKEDEPNA